MAPIATNFVFQAFLTRDESSVYCGALLGGVGVGLPCSLVPTAFTKYTVPRTDTEGLLKYLQVPRLIAEALQMLEQH